MSTGDQTDRADLPTSGSNGSLLGIAIGCLWVGGAFAVLIYTFSSKNQLKPIVPADEMARANRAMAAEPPSR